MWLAMHRDAVERFIYDKIDIDSQEDFILLDDSGFVVGGLAYQHLGEFRIIIGDYDRFMSEKIKEIMGYLIFGKSKILYVIGARDSGKTCFSFWLAEKIHEIIRNKIIAYIGASLNQNALPFWCKNYADINDVPNGALIILDELALGYNARNYQQRKNVELGQLLAIARHKDLSVIAITQDPNMGEINAWRLKDMVIYKMSNTYELPTRDNSRGGRSSKVLQFWSFIKNWLKPTKQEQALFEYQAKERIMLFEYSLPKCWTEELSKAFKFVDVRKEAVIFKEIPPKKAIKKEDNQKIKIKLKEIK